MTRMVDWSGVFRRAMITLDTDTVMRAWPHVFPAMPMPQTPDEALTALHLARTAAESMPDRVRVYSHRWLTERNFPSMLPDELRPKADQVGPPVMVDGVGISVNAATPYVGEQIGGAMQDAVLDVYANGDQDRPGLVARQMFVARARERRALGLTPLSMVKRTS